MFYTNSLYSAGSQPWNLHQSLVMMDRLTCLFYKPTWESVMLATPKQRKREGRFWWLPDFSIISWSTVESGWLWSLDGSSYIVHIYIYELPCRLHSQAIQTPQPPRLHIYIYMAVHIIYVHFEFKFDGQSHRL